MLIIVNYLLLSPFSQQQHVIQIHWSHSEWTLSNINTHSKWKRKLP